MAVRIKDLGQSAIKWARNAGAASAEYASGAIEGASAWETNTAAASGTYHQAVTGPGIQERFRRGVQRAGSEKYSRRIQDVGAGRYSTGVQAAEGDWQSGFAPFAQVIAGLTLPQRRPRGDPGNLQRVAAVAQALNARRLANLGAGA